jgi:hypothetical protein
MRASLMPSSIVNGFATITVEHFSWLDEWVELNSKACETWVVKEATEASWQASTPTGGKFTVTVGSLVAAGESVTSISSDPSTIVLENPFGKVATTESSGQGTVLTLESPADNQSSTVCGLKMLSKSAKARVVDYIEDATGLNALKGRIRTGIDRVGDILTVTPSGTVYTVVTYDCPADNEALVDVEVSEGGVALDGLRGGPTNIAQGTDHAGCMNCSAGDAYDAFRHKCPGACRPCNTNSDCNGTANMCFLVNGAQGAAAIGTCCYGDIFRDPNGCAKFGVSVLPAYLADYPGSGDYAVCGTLNEVGQLTSCEAFAGDPNAVNLTTLCAIPTP